MRSLENSAGSRVLGRPELFQDLQPPGLGQGARDPLELPLAVPAGSQGCHLSKVSRRRVAGNGWARGCWVTAALEKD
jgi:hypothetical protein